MPFLILLTRSGLLTLLLISTCLQADTATVSITGRILSSACVPDIDPLNVPMGAVSRTALGVKGATASATTFQLRLKSCPEEIHRVSVTFDGPSAAEDGSALALTAGPNTAAGVAVQLQDAFGQRLSLGQASSLMDIKGGNGTLNIMTFSARYLAITDAVTAGQANATATFTIIYES